MTPIFGHHNPASDIWSKYWHQYLVIVILARPWWKCTSISGLRANRICLTFALLSIWLQQPTDTSCEFLQSVKENCPLLLIQYEFLKTFPMQGHTNMWTNILRIFCLRMCSVAFNYINQKVLNGVAEAELNTQMFSSGLKVWVIFRSTLIVDSGEVQTGLNDISKTVTVSSDKFNGGNCEGLSMVKWYKSTIWVE